jgi:hypothetical protein
MKTHRLAILAFMLAGLLVACSAGEKGSVEIQLGVPFELAVGQSSRHAAGDLSLELDEILEDSRCPQQVQCVEAGIARLALTARIAANDAVGLVVHTNPNGSARLNDYEIRLVGLTPVPQLPGDTIPQRDYRASLVVTQDCPPRPDDPQGYLKAICNYVQEQGIRVSPGDATTYGIKRIEAGEFDERPADWVFLDCCFLGDIAVFDRQTGEIVDFQVGAK